MCGRYVFTPGKGWGLNEQKRSSFEANYNVAPMQTMPVITSDGIEPMRWGLIPSWSKDFKMTFTTINARAETLSEKPMYRGPFKSKRCLIPASGFYEWQNHDKTKQPLLFTVDGREMFNFAGLYDVWFDKDENPHKTYTIITTSPNKTMSGIHDRMPVILDEDEEQHWLSDESADQLQLLLDPFGGKMHKMPVSSDVGKVKNNYPELLNPV